ncbi:MAG: 50S ribosomal protein L18 [Thermodesulfobacteriota bacterium]
MLTNLRSPGRALRQARVRKRLQGTDQRPRLTVFRSLKHIYAQVISDESGRTLVSASSLSPEVRDKLGGKSGNKQAAREVGQLVARRAKDAGIAQVVFDRNGFLYHGRVRTLAEAAREGGLQF